LILSPGKILNIPIYCTTQNGAKLGATVLELTDILPSDTKEVDKTAFSMVCKKPNDVSTLRRTPTLITFHPLTQSILNK
jgi:hypothetical protein